jgi:hypothetical protein
VPTVTTFCIGCDGSGTQSLNGHIRHIAYFPGRLSNSELQLLTK